MTKSGEKEIGKAGMLLYLVASFEVVTATQPEPSMSLVTLGSGLFVDSMGFVNLLFTVFCADGKFQRKH